MTEQEKEELYQQVTLMAKYTGEDPVNKEQFFSYLDEPKERKEQPADLQAENRGIHEKLISFLQADTAGAELVREQLKEAREQAERQVRETREKARETKLFNIKRNREIRMARQKMKELQERRIAADKARVGVKAGNAYTGASKTNATSGRSYAMTNLWVQKQGLGEMDSRVDYDVTYPAFNNVAEGGSVDLTIRTEHSELHGHKYVPENATGKVVICFTGSHEPGANQIGTFAQNYLDQGVTVIHYDLRGYGKSTTVKDGEPVPTKLSEDTMYRDGMDIFNHVVAEMNVRPSDIIIHGYSLGAATASKVAANVCQNQQARDTELRKQGEYLSESQRLGGLVLHSPIPSAYDAYKMHAREDMDMVKTSGVAGFLGWAFAGGFNTVSHMERVHKYDPNLPVHYVGGKNPERDDLSPYVTHIHENPKAQFTNQSFHFSESAHAGQIDVNDPCFDELCQKGRAADLSGTMQRSLNPEMIGPDGQMKEDSKHMTDPANQWRVVL